MQQGDGMAVRGTAEVTIAADVKSMPETESINIPIAAVHWPAIRGRIALEHIAVQIGRCLAEDGNVRVDDVCEPS